jgi:hypothetical protein
MQKTSLVLIAGVAILAATAQSATPIEGNPRSPCAASQRHRRDAGVSLNDRRRSEFRCSEIGRGRPYARGQSRQGSRFDPNPRAAGQKAGSRADEGYNGPAMDGAISFENTRL